MEEDGKMAENKREVELPPESIPHVTYKDLEDSWRRGYGTEGVQRPVENRPGSTGGGTEGPTLAVSALTLPRSFLRQHVDEPGPEVEYLSFGRLSQSPFHYLRSLSKSTIVDLMFLFIQ